MAKEQGLGIANYLRRFNEENAKEMDSIEWYQQFPISREELIGELNFICHREDIEMTDDQYNIALKTAIDLYNVIGVSIVPNETVLEFAIGDASVPYLKVKFVNSYLLQNMIKTGFQYSKKNPFNACFIGIGILCCFKQSHKPLVGIKHYIKDVIIENFKECLRIVKVVVTEPIFAVMDEFDFSAVNTKQLLCNLMTGKLTWQHLVLHIFESAIKSDSTKQDLANNVHIANNSLAVQETSNTDVSAKSNIDESAT